MNKRSIASSHATVIAAALLLVAPAVQAQEVKALTSGAFAEAFLEVVPDPGASYTSRGSGD